MSEFLLENRTKELIMRRVFVSWAMRTLWPFAVLAGVLVFLGMSVSLREVARASAEATTSLDAFTEYWVAAFRGTETYVLAGVVLLLVGCYGALRNAMSGLYTRWGTPARS